MDDEELERFENEAEMGIYREYRDVLPMFRYVVETERRFYLANSVKVGVDDASGGPVFTVEMEDAWVWDMYRPARFVKKVKVYTVNDVNVEELDRPPVS